MNEPAKGRTGLYVASALIVLLGGVYGWKVLAVRSVERAMEAQRAGHVVQLRQALTRETSEMLRLTGLPLGWAVRAAVLKDDYDQVNDYFNRFVKEPFISLVAYVRIDGAIMAATDKKMEGQPAAAYYDTALFGADEVRVVDRGGGDILLVVPVMGFDSRLGTLVVSYARKAIDSRMPPAAAD